MIFHFPTWLFCHISIKSRLLVFKTGMKINDIFQMCIGESPKMDVENNSSIVVCLESSTCSSLNLWFCFILAKSDIIWFLWNFKKERLKQEFWKQSITSLHSPYLCWPLNREIVDCWLCMTVEMIFYFSPALIWPELSDPVRACNVAIIIGTYWCGHCMAISWVPLILCCRFI